MREKVLCGIKIFSLALVLLTASSVSLPQPAVAADLKIGFIDLQKAIAGTKDWKKSFTSFRNSFKKEKETIAKKEERLKKMLEDLNNKNFVLDPELKKAKAEKLNKEKVDFERYVQDKNAEFAKKEKEMTSKILEQMLEVLRKIGKEKKYTMILEQKALLFHDQGHDVTDLAIKTYDKTYK
ncbi:MAG: OmpH family outer membrane protein [Nitrospinaceae bacterium]|nr:MAG: OmpH family outer membrane protein [Nitrospinaceae bacterium]